MFVTLFLHLKVDNSQYSSFITIFFLISVHLKKITHNCKREKRKLVYFTCRHQCHWCLVLFCLDSSPPPSALSSPTTRGIFFFDVCRTSAWHWWCCKQFKNQDEMGLLGGVSRRSDMTRWRLFRDGGTSPALVTAQDHSRHDSPEPTWVIGTGLWFVSGLFQSHSWVCLEVLPRSAPPPTPRSCTRQPRSGSARCTAYRWAPRCISWSCWYWGWTWLWTD